MASFELLTSQMRSSNDRASLQSCELDMGKMLLHSTTAECAKSRCGSACDLEVTLAVDSRKGKTASLWHKDNDRSSTKLDEGEYPMMWLECGQRQARGSYIRWQGDDWTAVKSHAIIARIGVIDDARRNRGRKMGASDGSAA